MQQQEATELRTRAVARAIRARRDELQRKAAAATPPGVATVLAAARITGEPGNAAKCPLYYWFAPALADFSGRFAVALNTVDWYAPDTHRAGHPDVEVFLGSLLEDFRLDFDCHRFPELEETTTTS